MAQNKGGWFWHLIAPYVYWGSVKYFKEDGGEEIEDEEIEVEVEVEVEVEAEVEVELEAEEVVVVRKWRWRSKRGERKPGKSVLPVVNLIIELL